MEDTERHKFMVVVEHSFLSEAEKGQLRNAARGGVSDELWRELNDRLVASIVARAKLQSDADGNIDREVQRFSAEYEAEKSRIDREMWDLLKTVPAEEEARRKELWRDYERRIDELQTRLLQSVRSSSATVLKDVILQVAMLEA